MESSTLLQIILMACLYVVCQNCNKLFSGDIALVSSDMTSGEMTFGRLDMLAFDA